ncbi:uncharacterized protein LY79DRAFT_416500 [Colletotrichum navitas]|uniref:Uncharacterized protein n=1 Tax=Colletotrichum navitas TaxID=681940 RepID=A0AAD8PP70_9PEZI|nr:uncharacterized protein LY79DRAFT_416500 [Colletotrichum navitas]KAK1573199.1 hypothetical protein LY79DRAFT_416500 [Colletotrichum navitas]
MNTKQVSQWCLISILPCNHCYYNQHAALTLLHHPMCSSGESHIQWHRLPRLTIALAAYGVCGLDLTATIVHQAVGQSSPNFQPSAAPPGGHPPSLSHTVNHAAGPTSLARSLWVVDDDCNNVLYCVHSSYSVLACLLCLPRQPNYASESLAAERSCYVCWDAWVVDAAAEQPEFRRTHTHTHSLTRTCTEYIYMHTCTNTTE